LFQFARPNPDEDQRKGSAVAIKQLSGWQMVTLIVMSIAIIAAAAVVLILGKDALITMAVIFVIGLVLVAWLNS
jgi:hypothetical protein